MLRKFIAVTFLLLMAQRVGLAQEVVPDQDPVTARLHTRTNRFLTDVGTGKTQTAFEELLADSQLRKQTEAMQGLVDKTKDLERKYGRYRSHERLGVKKIGADLVLMQYLYKCDQFPVVWYFTYYRNFAAQESAMAGSNEWVLVAVRFDTDLEALGL